MSGLSVLHVAQPLDAGVPRVVATLMADQVGRGWQVSVACPPQSDLRRCAEACGARYLPWPATRSPGLSTLGESRRLAKAMADTGPDLAHLHSSKAGLAGRLALRGAVPTVFQPHAWSFEAVRGPVRAAATAWERSAARWADVVVCVSADERRRGEAAGVRARWAELPNGVDLSDYRPAGEPERSAARDSLGLGDAPVVVLVGRLSEQKGQDVALAAWPEVLRRVPEASLVLVGDGPRRERLEAPAPAGVRFAGGSEDVKPWLAAANVVTIPSRWEAGLSLVAMEAMARGRSVVATDVAGMRAGLGDGCGAIVPIDDTAALAAALAERLLDPERADREGAAGRRRVEHVYDVRRTTERMAELYEDVLARRRGER